MEGAACAPPRAGAERRPRLVQRPYQRLGPAGRDGHQRAGARLSEARLPRRAGVEEERLLAPLDRRPVTVTADHEVEALGHRIVAVHQVGAYVADEQAQAGDLGADLPREVVEARVLAVGVASHRRSVAPACSGARGSPGR